MKSWIDDIRQGAFEGLGKFKARAKRLDRKVFTDPNDYRKHTEKVIADLETELHEAERQNEESGETIEVLERKLAALEPVVILLKSGGVRAILLNHFHPDKNPTMSPVQKQRLNEMIQIIMGAYASLEGK